MKTLNRFYINGQWVKPGVGSTQHPIVNPADESTIGTLTLGTADDADRAVAAARAAFPAWSQTSREERIVLLERIFARYRARADDLAEAVRLEMGAPASLCKGLHVPAGLMQIEGAIKTLRDFRFEREHGRNYVRREPIGVAALIAPWNWPLNQICAKVAPAIAAGCTVVLKPSEFAALDAVIFADIMAEAGTPPGVFNMIFGEGRVVGAALSAHRDVDMVSITGSTRAGVEVALAAAPTVKRVTQELGGKSALLVLDDADLRSAVKSAVVQCMTNSGQTCVAPTRVLVPRAQMQEAAAVAAAVCEQLAVGDPADPATRLGPLANRAQHDKVRQMIRIGMEEGATLVAGGPERPTNTSSGFYVRPTVFANVDNTMQIAREEIFGPVLALIAYDSEEHAIEIANDSPYGLAAYVYSSDDERARRVANRLRAGILRINNAQTDFSMPLGGYKTSGNGREYGEEGFNEYLEIKSVMR
ncbi:aldehyde dehydrogenase family protein [Paraburkholderia sp. Ac-20340]|uniref:aldehyde dehydrogenase family protein n=1 Tax=Paraburkholderia sp. Ac-20340 TaxID=2703888 RepID=UPI0019803F11|nr:aldehyde dehydrogenase family protein [Paraburkholderia sp. Ac-20340]MBN3853735.1 aldehyde dehydrogenase family protein [Paraburkholderia sp. Ac-20340]